MVKRPTDITKASQEVRPLLDSLIKAEDRMQSYIALGSLTNFLESGENEKILAFCIESWQVGRAIFNAALDNGITEVANFPETMRLGISTIASVWSGEFKKHPKQSSEGLQWAETQLWKNGDKAAEFWILWLRSALKHSLGRDVQEIMSQYLQRRDQF